jgi:hypothetical protein
VARRYERWVKPLPPEIRCFTFEVSDPYGVPHRGTVVRFAKKSTGPAAGLDWVRIFKEVAGGVRFAETSERNKSFMFNTLSSPPEIIGAKGVLSPSATAQFVSQKRTGRAAGAVGFVLQTHMGEVRLVSIGSNASLRRIRVYRCMLGHKLSRFNMLSSSMQAGRSGSFVSQKPANGVVMGWAQMAPTTEASRRSDFSFVAETGPHTAPGEACSLRSGDGPSMMVWNVVWNVD